MQRESSFTRGSFPVWMRHVLVAAGIYNLAWGAVTVGLPYWLFDLTGMERPNYPFIWQCVGMIVGVYGIGYLAAAADPLRHWPIVLVGFLGKIFGPLGYALGVARALAASAYRHGARFVDVGYFDPHVKHARLANADPETL